MNSLFAKRATMLSALCVLELSTCSMNIAGLLRMSYLKTSIRLSSITRYIFLSKIRNIATKSARPDNENPPETQFVRQRGLEVKISVFWCSLCPRCFHKFGSGVGKKNL